MQQDGSQTPKNRPRARTGANFPNILKGRKSEPSPATPTSPPSQDDPPSHLSIEALVEALTPPAVLSLSHARGLSVVLQHETPEFDILTPVIARLCEPGVPSAFLATGLDVISACATSESHSLSDLERASLFSILRSSDADWAPETWKARIRCLSTLTKEGSIVAGFEIAFLRFAERCIYLALEGLLSDDESDRYMRESYIMSVSHILRKTLDHTASSYSEQDFVDVLRFFDGCVQQSITRLSGSQHNTPTLGTPPSLASHRRNASSLGSSTPYAASRQPPREPITPLDMTVLPVQLYLDFLDVYRRQLSSENITNIVSLLLRIVAVHINPLPRLSPRSIPQHRPRPTEEAALKHLFALLSGPYSNSVALSIRANLASENSQEALGAFRTFRAVLREAAASRMASVTLRRSKFDPEDYAPTGQLIVTEAYADILERAHREGVEVPSFNLSRVRNYVGNAIRDWSSRFDAEKVLDEALGLVKDIITETNDRVDEREREPDPFAFTVDEGRFIGTILSETVKYAQRLR